MTAPSLLETRLLASSRELFQLLRCAEAASDHIADGRLRTELMQFLHGLRECRNRLQAAQLGDVVRLEPTDAHSALAPRTALPTRPSAPCDGELPSNRGVPAGENYPGESVIPRLSKLI